MGPRGEMGLEVGLVLCPSLSALCFSLEEGKWVWCLVFLFLFLFLMMGGEDEAEIHGQEEEEGCISCSSKHCLVC